MIDPLHHLIEDIDAQVAEKYAGTDYTDSYVAFLDVMGMKDLVGRPYADLRRLFNAAESGQELYGRIQVPERRTFIGQSHLKMTIMSDSLVLSIASTIDQAFAKLIGFSSYLIQQLIHVLDKPVFLRGGIARGQIFQDGKVVFGPGLVAAHKLENEVANSMRCVVAPDLQDDATVQDYLEREGCALVVDPDDKMHFIDFVRRENRARLAAIASEVLASNAKDELKQKYKWLNRYLDRTASA